MCVSLCVCVCALCASVRIGVKRVTLVKDPDKGIGCTIKNAAGHILVNRIVEDGPIAITGVLRPGKLGSGGYYSLVHNNYDTTLE